MKKVFLAILISVLCFIPFSVNAEEKEYKTLNLDEALKEEKIDHDFSNYKETDDQAIIYLFRGKGCAYCKKFLTYLNSIVDDYGKYFKVVSYEVWYDNDNAELMEKVGNLLGQKAEGVPYIVIGDKVFAGYAESYNDEIKEAIKKQYDSKNEYDVMKKLAESSDNAEETTTTKSSDTTALIIIVNLLFIAVATVIIVLFNNKNKLEIMDKLEEMDSVRKTKKGAKNEA